MERLGKTTKISVMIVTNLTEISRTFIRKPRGHRDPLLFGTRTFTYTGVYFRARFETYVLKRLLYLFYLTAFHNNKC